LSVDSPIHHERIARLADRHGVCKGAGQIDAGAMKGCQLTRGRIESQKSKIRCVEIDLAGHYQARGSRISCQKCPAHIEQREILVQVAHNRARAELETLEIHGENVFVPPVVQRSGNYIGRSYWPDGWLQGDIAEILLYNRTLNAAEQQAVSNYLASKYGLSF